MSLGSNLIGVKTKPRAAESRRIIWSVALITAVFTVWAAYAPLDEIVRGNGRVVPTMKNQIIQNFEGGIVSEIYVTEGDEVNADQIVAVMDATRFQSAYQELREQQWALSLKLARLEVEADMSAEFVPNAELQRLAPAHVASELQLFRARREELLQSVKHLEEAVTLKGEEAGLLRSMAERSAIPQIELIRAEQAVVDVQMRLDSIRTEFEAMRTQDYSETLFKLRQVEEQIRSREDQLNRTQVRSPIRGVVNKVLATTIGGVVQPGDPIIEVLSLEGELRIEGRIDPMDIGFVYAGMPATVKLTAFDFSIFGTLTGTVVHVGADTVVDETQRDPRPYYEVFISLESSSLDGPSGRVDIRPGMQAQIELHSGQKTVLQYILKPLFKTTEALSER